MCVCVCVCVCVYVCVLGWPLLNLQKEHSHHIYIYIYISGVGRCQKVGVAYRHVIYVPLVKNQYKQVVFGCMVI